MGQHVDLYLRIKFFEKLSSILEILSERKLVFSLSTTSFSNSAFLNFTIYPHWQLVNLKICNHAMILGKASEHRQTIAKSTVNKDN